MGKAHHLEKTEPKNIVRFVSRTISIGVERMQ
jgi:hypothetical protein